jgi:uncharacterized protein with ATP-grasp and redox domains
MRTFFDCYPCFLRQALNASRRVGADETQQYTVMQKTVSLFQEIKPTTTPPEIAYQVHRIVRETVNSDDPYKKAKENSTKDALVLYPELKRLLAESDDPLDTAIRISIAGNIIDFGVIDHLEDLEEIVDKVIKQDYQIDDTKSLRKKLSRADQILFLADNAGETVFDRVLIESLPMEVIYAVKGGPILNDATIEDALAAGLDQCATLVSNGSNAPGTILHLCSDEFQQIFKLAPVVIAKGQANYETLSESDNKVFCLLQVKCPVIADDVGVPEGSIVVYQAQNKMRVL